MSVQLIVYPQITSSFVLPTEVVSNGNNFVNVGNNTSTYPAPYSTLSQQAITALSPLTYPNTWYGYYTPTTSGAPSSPTDAVLLAGEGCGILQNLTNLTAGLVYNLEITVDVTGISYVPINIDIFNGAVLDTAIVMTPTSDVTTVQFIAPNSSMTALAVTNINASYNDFIIITNISVMAAPTADGQVILDLYEDEDLPLTLSVEDFKNVAENVASYSKAFNLPATKRNNKAFDYIFEITRDYQGLIFNPYQKTECLLKQDGFLLFKGYLRLLDVTDKLGEISYNVNLYSEVVALADTLKDRTFSDLGFTELEHDYNRTQIQNSWNGVTTGIDYNNPNTSGFRDDYSTVKYPFVDWNHNYPIGDTGNPVLPSLETAFRPFINIKYLIDRIFQASGFTYESTFISSDEDFNNLYMDFNWGSDENPNNVLNTGQAVYVTNETPTVYATTSFTNMVFDDVDIPTIAGFDNTTNTFTCPVGQDNTTYNISANARVWATKDDSVSFRWRKVSGGVEEIIYSYSDTLEGSAIVVVNYTTIAGGSVASVNVIDGGYYPGGAPTISLQSMFGAGATFTITMAGTAISAIAVNTSGGSYSNNDVMRFNLVAFSNPTTIASSNIIQTLNAGDTLEFQWKALTYSDSVRQQNNPYFNDTTFSFPTGTLVVSVSLVGTTSDTLLQTLRGEVGQWDFLKGLITMFNLVTLPDEDNPNNIIIEPYGDVFISTGSGTTLADRGIQHDWTDKIDVSEMKLTPLADLNKKTMFKFVEDDDDYSFNQYKNLVGGHLYGSQKWDAWNEFNILEGTEEIIAEPFAATVVKPLMSQFPDFITPAIYARGGDATWEGFDNSPRIMYNNGIKSTGTSYYIPEQNGVTSSDESDFLQFSHLSDIPASTDTLDFHFGICQLMPGVGAATANNLFQLYWLPYYSQLYNPNTRIMTIKVNLNASDINLFKFNDKVFLKNRVFRVNKIDYNPNDLSTVEFILIT